MAGSQGVSHMLEQDGEQVLTDHRISREKAEEHGDSDGAVTLGQKRFQCCRVYPGHKVQVQAIGSLSLVRELG